MLDNGKHLKVAGFGSISFSQLSSDKSRLLNHGAHIDLSSKCPLCACEKLFPFFDIPLRMIDFMIQLFADYCVAPEIYKDEIFDRSVDSYSFGVVLYEVGTL